MTGYSLIVCPHEEHFELGCVNYIGESHHNQDEIYAQKLSNKTR